MKCKDIVFQRKIVDYMFLANEINFFYYSQQEKQRHANDRDYGANNSLKRYFLIKKIM